MIILLDIDGVMVTTPSWRSTELLSDGFLKFNEVAARNLALLIAETNASVIITSTHRISFSLESWRTLLNNRGISITFLSKINDCQSLSDMPSRATEILEWFDTVGKEENYVVIDDDQSLENLPASIKNRWVKTKPMIGFDDAALEKALKILKG